MCRLIQTVRVFCLLLMPTPLYLFNVPSITKLRCIYVPLRASFSILWIALYKPACNFSMLCTECRSSVRFLCKLNLSVSISGNWHFEKYFVSNGLKSVIVFRAAETHFWSILVSFLSYLLVLLHQDGSIDRSLWTTTRSKLSICNFSREQRTHVDDLIISSHQNSYYSWIFRESHLDSSRLLVRTLYFYEIDWWILLHISEKAVYCIKNCLSSRSERSAPSFNCNHWGSDFRFILPLPTYNLFFASVVSAI